MKVCLTPASSIIVTYVSASPFGEFMLWIVIVRKVVVVIRIAEASSEEGQEGRHK